MYHIDSSKTPVSTLKFGVKSMSFVIINILNNMFFNKLSMNHSRNNSCAWAYSNLHSCIVRQKNREKLIQNLILFAFNCTKFTFWFKCLVMWNVSVCWQLSVGSELSVVSETSAIDQFWFLFRGFANVSLRLDKDRTWFQTFKIIIDFYCCQCQYCQFLLVL